MKKIVLISLFIFSSTLVFSQNKSKVVVNWLDWDKHFEEKSDGKTYFKKCDCLFIGIVEMLNNEGLLWNTKEYLSGLKNGWQISYWENGKVKSIEQFENNKYTGKAYYFFDDGSHDKTRDFSGW